MKNNFAISRLFLFIIFFSTQLLSNIQDFRKNLSLYKNDQDNIELLSKLLDSFDQLNVNEVKRAQKSLTDNNFDVSNLRDKYKNYLININKRQEIPVAPAAPVVEKIVKTKVDFNSEAAKVLDNVRQDFVTLANNLSGLRAIKEHPAAHLRKTLNQVEELYKKLKNIKKISNEQLIKEKIALEKVLEQIYSDFPGSKDALKTKYKSELNVIKVPNNYSKEERNIFESLVQARIDILNFFNELSGNITTQKGNELASVLKEVGNNISKLNTSNPELKKQKEEIELLVKDYSIIFR